MPASSLTLLLSSASMNSFVLQNSVIPELVFKNYKRTSSSIYKLLTFGIGFYIDSSSNIKRNPSKVCTAFLKSIKYISMQITCVISTGKLPNRNELECSPGALYIGGCMRGQPYCFASPGRPLWQIELSGLLTLQTVQVDFCFLLVGFLLAFYDFQVPQLSCPVFLCQIWKFQGLNFIKEEPVQKLRGTFMHRLLAFVRLDGKQKHTSLQTILKEL